MSVSELRQSGHIAAWTARLAGLSLRTVLLLIIHGAALVLMALTETTPVSTLLFLLSWGLFNFLWLVLLPRPTVAAALSLVVMIVIVVMSRFKYDIVWMTADFLDVMLIDFDTVAYFLTIYQALRWIVPLLLIATVAMAVMLWRLGPYRIRRRTALLGLAACSAGIIAVSFAAPGDWWEVFSKNNFISKFSRSAVSEISELITHGFVEADAVAAGNLPKRQEAACPAPAKLPHVILVHDESSFDIRVAPGIKVPEGYGSHFVSYDGKARHLLVESYGGASWYSEFAALTGLSSRSFGRFAYFLPRIAAGHIHRGLPFALRHCGYRTFSFYPAASAFMSARSFQMSTGIEHFFDYRDMGTRIVEPDSFYFDAAATKLRQEHGAGPMFAFVYLAANHFPFSRSWNPDLLPGWRDPGNTPEVDEYLRRQARSDQDYRGFLDRLRRDFPGESFLILRYGDHQPAFPTFIMDPDLDKATVTKRMQTYDPRYFTTYYAFDTINYQPVDASMALDTLDAPYLPLVVQQMVGVPLDSSFVEQKRIFQRCAGIFYGCAAGAEVRRFTRLLIDANELERGSKSTGTSQ